MAAKSSTLKTSRKEHELTRTSTNLHEAEFLFRLREDSSLFEIPESEGVRSMNLPIAPHADRYMDHSRGTECTLVSRLGATSFKTSISNGMTDSNVACLLSLVNNTTTAKVRLD